MCGMVFQSEGGGDVLQRIAVGGGDEPGRGFAAIEPRQAGKDLSAAVVEHHDAEVRRQLRVPQGIGIVERTQIAEHCPHLPRCA